MNNHIFVTAKITVKKEKISESIALMEFMTIETNNKEVGCVAYYYLQNIDNEREFTSYEVWDNEQSEANHWLTSHVQEALAIMPNLLETEPEIVKWKKIEKI